MNNSCLLEISYLEVVGRGGVLVVMVTLIAHGLVGLVLLVVHDIHSKAGFKA